MTHAPTEQRNPYKGSPERPWIRLRFEALDGSLHELDLLADTGSPFAVIIGVAAMAMLKVKSAADVLTNFDWLAGGWLQLAVPDLGLTQAITGYASNKVVAATALNHPDFQGLAGLPLLRLLEYGGDANEFWIRRATTTP